MARSALDRLHREGRGVGFEVGSGVEFDAVEEGFGAGIGSGVGVADFLHGFFIDVGAHDLLGDAFVVGSAFDKAPAAELREPPLGVFGLRVVAVAIAEDHVVRVLELASVAHEVFAFEAAEDGLRRAVDVGSGADDVRLLGAVLHLVEPHAGLVQSLEHGFDGLRILRGELLGEGADFFRVILPNRLRGDGGETDVFRDGFRIPRFADAEAVHLADLHVGYHLWRRHGDERNIRASTGSIAGIDASRSEVVAHPHRMSSGRECHREGHRHAFGLGIINEGLQCLRIIGDLAFVGVAERDGLAVAVHDPRDDYRLLWSTTEAHGGGDRHAEKHVRGMNVAIRERITNRSPTRAFAHGGVDAVFFEEAFFVRDDDGRAVSEGDDAEFEIGGFWRFIGIGGTDPARGQTGEEGAEASVAENVASCERSGGVHSRSDFCSCFGFGRSWRRLILGKVVTHWMSNTQRVPEQPRHAPPV